MEVKLVPYTVISPENRGGGGGRNSEQGVTARQYGITTSMNYTMYGRLHVT